MAAPDQQEPAWHSQLGHGVLLLTEHEQFHRKPFSDKNMNIVQTTKMTEHSRILSNMSDYWFFSSLSFSLASFLSSFREELLGYPNTKLLMFPKRIQSKENLHFLKTSSSFWKYFLSFRSLIDIDLLFVTLNVTEEKSLRLTWLFLLLWKFTFLLVSKLKILFFCCCCS